jgi:hypothetical protein
VCCYKRVDRISTTIKQLKPFSSSYRILQFDRGWLLNEYETRKSRINGYRQKRNLRDRRTAVSKFASDGQTNRILIFSLPFRRKKKHNSIACKKIKLDCRAFASSSVSTLTNRNKYSNNSIHVDKNRCRAHLLRCQHARHRRRLAAYTIDRSTDVDVRRRTVRRFVDVDCLSDQPCPKNRTTITNISIGGGRAFVSERSVWPACRRDRRTRPLSDCLR